MPASPSDISSVDNLDRSDLGSQRLVTTLARGLDVLAVFAYGELLGNLDIASRTGLSKATVSRLCATLLALGYLRLDERTRKYAMGGRLLALGACVQHHSGLLVVAKPHMLALAASTGMTVGMAARDRLGMVFLDAARGAGPRFGPTSVGSVVPIAQTALGLAFPFPAQPVERIALLQQLRSAYGVGWPAVRDRIERAITEYQRDGFVVRVRSCEDSVSGVGASVLLPGAHGRIAFNCATTSNQHGIAQQLLRAGQALRSMVQAIERELSLQPPAPKRSIGGGRKATVTVFSSV